MPGRDTILNAYRSQMQEYWRDGHLSLEEIEALKVFCATYQITAEEHESVASQLQVDRRELIDEHNQPFSEWMRSKQSLAAHLGKGRFTPGPAVTWRQRLAPPGMWQNALAIVAGTLLLIVLVMLLVTH